MDTGPYLKAALFCSDAIEGKDGVLSLIRIIDRMTVAAAGPQPPQEMPTVSRVLKLVLMFISGRTKGTQNVEIKSEGPDGKTEVVWGGTVFFEGEDRGANLIIDMNIDFQREGLYWFDIYFEGTRITRVPFRVIYQRAGRGMATS